MVTKSWMKTLTNPLPKQYIQNPFTFIGDIKLIIPILYLLESEQNIGRTGEGCVNAAL